MKLDRAQTAKLRSYLLRAIDVAARGDLTPEEIREMNEGLKRMAESVEGLDSVVDSIEQILSGVSSQIRSNASDRDQMLKLADDIDAQKRRLANAAAAATAAEGDVKPDTTDTTGSGAPAEGSGGGQGDAGRAEGPSTAAENQSDVPSVADQGEGTGSSTTGESA